MSPYFGKRVPLREILFLSIAGAAGTASRYALSTWTQRLTGGGFPFGTLLVNVLGCLLLGVVVQLGAATQVVPRAWQVPITVGFFGAFTTFSTFGYETIRLVEQGQAGYAAANAAANLFTCLLAAWAGLALGRALFGAA